MNLRWLRGRGGLLLAAAVGYVVLAGATVAAIVWSGLGGAQRESLGAALAGQTATLVLGAVLTLAGLAAILTHALGRYPATASRLAADTRLLVGANPDHRVDTAGPAELRELAEAVNDLAERRLVAERDVDREVSAARADVEQERNRLAALMADLDVAVVVASLGGRVLLYNSAARSLLEDDPALGLGRSVFGIIDRGLVTHGLDRINDGSAQSHVSTMLRGGQLLHVRLSPVRGGDGSVSGFVLVLEDLTSRQRSGARRDALIRELIETTRASLASIQAAVETVLDFPDMDESERSQFIGIARAESHRLGRQVEAWDAEQAADPGTDWLLTEMRGEDLLTVLGREVERGGAVATSVQSPADELWVRVDSHALAIAAVRLAARLRERCSVRSVTLSLTEAGRHGGLDLRWTGVPPDPDAFKGWLAEPLAGAAAKSIQDVVERHDGEIWCSEGPDGSAYVRLLLALTDAEPTPLDHPGAAQRPATPAAGDGRRPPELYDFDLFDLPEAAIGWADRRLGDLAYTVFDTETTGFQPAAGDEVVSLGAVRVVNGRLLRHESFERLVDPRRSVPAASVAVHGITTDMLLGQPTMDVVLPLFARFADDTVLVGHNVGFDMGFLRAKEAQTGVRLAQPVLDTLLLDAALHPDHEHHSLEAIATRFGIGVVGRHTALGDALLTAEVFIRLLKLLHQRGIGTLGEALESSRATYQARLDARLYGG